MEVNGELYALATLLLGKEPSVPIGCSIIYTDEIHALILYEDNSQREIATGGLLCPISKGK
jgi:hypothetical protein